MPPVKKIRRLTIEPLDEAKALAAIEIQLSATKRKSNFLDIPNIPQITYEYDSKGQPMLRQFERTYNNTFAETVSNIWQFYLYIFTDESALSPKEIFNKYKDCINLLRSKPLKLFTKFDMVNRHTGWIILSSHEWAFNDFIYEVKGLYSDEEARLLVLEDFDRERKRFEKLQLKFDKSSSPDDFSPVRPRIPESIRIEVWRRDSGKCARCGSREKLEYDHIVPISKGGSNTARNIELLCELHNRSKSNNVV